MSDEMIEELSLDKIRIDGDTQPRIAVYEEVVDEYRRDMRKGACFPPVEVVFDGSSYWLCDGFHRFKAARLAQRQTLKAIVHKGTQQDALWRCLGANALHGLRRSNQDKAWSIARALTMRPDRSNRLIARHVGVDHSTVNRLRSEMESTGEIHHLPRLRGRDGRWRPARLGPRTFPPTTGEDRQALAASLRALGKTRRHWDGRYQPGVRPLPIYDFAGHSVDSPGREHLLEVFDRRRELAGFMKRAQRLQEDMLLAFEAKSPLYAALDWRRLDALLGELVKYLRDMLPHSMCTQCQGAGCPACSARGWVDHATWDAMWNELNARRQALLPPMAAV